MDRISKMNILDCPLCEGAAALFEEGGWAFTVQCCDCGCQTAVSTYNTPEQREQAAAAAIECWNMGKVIHPGPGE